MKGSRWYHPNIYWTPRLPDELQLYAHRYRDWRRLTNGDRPVVVHCAGHVYAPTRRRLKPAASLILHRGVRDFYTVRRKDNQ